MVEKTPILVSMYYKPGFLLIDGGRGGSELFGYFSIDAFTKLKCLL